MSRFKKILLGIATAWPFAYIVMFFMFILLMIGLAPGNGGGDPGAVFGVFFLFFMVVHIITILLILGLQIFYIVNTIKNEGLSQNAKIAWILGLFFGGLFAMPIYWYINIWKKDDEASRGYPGLESGDFEPAYDAEWEKRQHENVPREPHSWR